MTKANNKCLAFQSYLTLFNRSKNNILKSTICFSWYVPLVFYINYVCQEDSKHYLSIYISVKVNIQWRQ